jgi:hypothetical protein
MTILVVDLTNSKRENQQKNRQHFCQIDKSLFKLTGYQMKFFFVNFRNYQIKSKTCQLFFSVILALYFFFF